MNMKRFGFMMAVPFVLLVGCGDGEELKTTVTDSEEVVETDAEPSSVEDSRAEETETYESELGVNKIYMKDKELTITETMGSVQFTINQVQTSRLSVAQEYEEMFEGEKEVTVIALNMIAENTVDDTVSFHPNQATLVTNTGEQVTPDLWFSDDVGGEFLGKVKKEGNVLFFVKAQPEELTELKVVVDGPFDENYNQLAEDRYEYKVDVTK